MAEQYGRGEEGEGWAGGRGEGGGGGHDNGSKEES